MTYPTIRPELTLDFANSRQLDPRITFSRTQVTGQATYLNPDTGLIAYASEHEARFEKEGLLIEESRTNYSDNSVAFTNTGGGTLAWTPNATTSPDGTTTAYKSVPVAGFVDRNTAQLSNLINGTGGVFTGSVFVKKETLRYAHISINGSDYYYGRLFDLDTGTFVDTNSYNNPTSVDSTVESFPNGWYRISVSRASPVSETVVKFSVGSTDNATPSYPYGQVTYVADGTSGMYFWGAQLEAGFLTSYIPTSGSEVTRSPDIAQITGDNFSSWYNQSEGTLTINAADVKEGKYVSSLTSGTTGTPDTLALYRKDDDEWRVYHTASVTFSATGSDANFAAGYSVSGSTRTASAAWKGSLVSNVPTDASSIPFTSLQIGTGPKTSGISNGHIARLSYYPRRLTDLELETITL